MPDSSEEAELIINIEAQHKSNTGYILEKRGIYYLSRLISSQYNAEFTKSDFNKLKKVYSIWICTNSPKKTANTITRHSFRPEYMVGEVPDCPEKYDLMSLVMINLGESDKNYDELIKMLDTLLNRYIENREVDSMCNLSQGIYDQGKIESKIEMIKAMSEEGTTLETALRIAKIDKETYEKYNSES